MTWTHLAHTRPVSVIVIIWSAPDSSISAKAAWKVTCVPGRLFSNLAFRWIVSKIFAISHLVRGGGGWPGHAAAHTWSYNVHSPPRGSLLSCHPAQTREYYSSADWISKLWWYCSCVDNSRVGLHQHQGVDIGPGLLLGHFQTVSSGFLNCSMHSILVPTFRSLSWNKWSPHWNRDACQQDKLRFGPSAEILKTTRWRPLLGYYHKIL